MVVFLWPADFYYHYAAFLAPFLALAIALPVSRLVTAARSAAGQPLGVGRLARPAMAVAGIAVIVMAAVQFGLEAASRAPLSPRTPGLPQSDVAAARRIIPPGACVLADQVSYAIAADRFISRVPGCSLMVDSVGTRLFAVGRPERAHRGGEVPGGTRRVARRVPARSVRLAFQPGRQADPVAGAAGRELLRPQLRPRTRRAARPLHP